MRSCHSTVGEHPGGPCIEREAVLGLIRSHTDKPLVISSCCCAPGLAGNLLKRKISRETPCMCSTIPRARALARTHVGDGQRPGSAPALCAQAGAATAPVSTARTTAARTRARTGETQKPRRLSAQARPMRRDAVRAQGC